MNPHLLVLGGAKSGKSSHALAQAEKHPGPKIFLATATAGDAEMELRIQRHQAERGDAWQTVEEPLALEQALESRATAGTLILVDCLTLWLSNLMTRANLDLDQVEARSQALARLVPGLPGRIILVANEVGLGIVPDNALARAYRDAAGRLNQLMAKACGRVVLVTAGLAQTLKDSS